MSGEAQSGVLLPAEHVAKACQQIITSIQKARKAHRMATYAIEMERRNKPTWFRRWFSRKLFTIEEVEATWAHEDFFNLCQCGICMSNWHCWEQFSVARSLLSMAKLAIEHSSTTGVPYRTGYTDPIRPIVWVSKEDHGYIFG